MERAQHTREHLNNKESDDCKLTAADARSNAQAIIESLDTKQELAFVGEFECAAFDASHSRGQHIA